MKVEELQLELMKEGQVTINIGASDNTSIAYIADVTDKGTYSLEIVEIAWRSINEFGSDLDFEDLCEILKGWGFIR